MPDSDAPSRSDSRLTPEPVRNLPVPFAASPAPERDSFIARLLRVLFGRRSGSFRSDLETALGADASGESSLSLTERLMLRNILDLRERRTEDVMVPRADIVAVQRDVSLADLVKLFESAGHSRLVVYNDTLDDPVGMVHIRDLIAYMSRRAAERAQAGKSRRKNSKAGLDLAAVDLTVTLSETGIIRQILFVPPSMPAIDLLAKMQATRIHLALVIDEYGGTDGLASIEDIVEEIVGEIEDEHDEAEQATVVRQPDGSFLADARANLEDVVALIGPEFDVGDAAEEVDTIGGYLMSQALRLPVRGELVPGPGPFEMEVLDADPRRVKKLKIYRVKHRALASIEGTRVAVRPASPATAPAGREEPAAQESAPDETAAAQPAPAEGSPAPAGRTEP